MLETAAFVAVSLCAFAVGAFSVQRLSKGQPPALSEVFDRIRTVEGQVKHLETVELARIEDSVSLKVEHIDDMLDAMEKKRRQVAATESAARRKGKGNGQELANENPMPWTDPTLPESVRRAALRQAVGG